MIKLGILGSTRGTNMLTLIEAIESGTLAASIEVVISNKSNALILERAAAKGIPIETVNPKGFVAGESDRIMSDLLSQYHVDLVVLIGYMRILSKEFVSLWNNKIINVHPSLLPAFAGKMDGDVHQAVLDSGVKETGCTIHYVTEQVDAGPIILQKKCRVLAGDTADSLKERVQLLEGCALIEAISVIRHSTNPSIAHYPIHS
ncbi:MAG: phosphoribosylglycinamide formyltransferase [Legionellales bacterium]